MRRLLKWVGIICLIPIVLVLLLAILLYIPPVQNFVIGKAVGYANSATGLDISMKSIRIGFPLKLNVKGVMVTIPEADTLLTAQSLTAHIKPFPLLKKEVEFGGFNLETVTLNTDTLIDGMLLKGGFTTLDLDINVINLNEEKVKINAVNLSDALVDLTITEPKNEKDTASQPAQWVVDIGKIDLNRVNLTMAIPASQLRLQGYVDKAGLSDGVVDLGEEKYTVGTFTMNNSTFKYDANLLAPQNGLDPNHINLQDLNMDISSVSYQGKNISAEVNDLKVKERSGLAITSFKGKIESDSTHVQSDQMVLKTTDSELTLMANVPWSALEKDPGGSARIMLRGTIGKNDLVRVAGQLPSDIKNSYPNRPLSVIAGIEGNMNALHIRQFKAELPDAFTVIASGTVRQVMDNNRRSGNLKLSAETRDMRFVNELLPPASRDRIRIPSGMKLSAEVNLSGTDYRGRVLLTESQGSVRLNGRYDTATQSYTANIDIRNLQPDHFLPKDSLFWLTANIQAQGRGTDIYSASTRANIKGIIEDIRYGSTEVHTITLEGTLAQNHLQLTMDSTDPIADIDLTVDGILRKNFVSGTVALEANHIDFQQLHLLTDTVATTFSLYAEGESDLQKDYKVDLTIGNWEIATPARTYRPKILTLHANMDVDTTRVSLHTGDLGVVLTGNADIQTMAGQFTTISQEVNRQMAQDSMVRISALRPLLPDMTLEATAGTDNLLYSYLAERKLKFGKVYVNANTSPEEGINANAGVINLDRDTLRIDTIQVSVWQDTDALSYQVEVDKNRYRNQAPFTAEVKGQLTDREVDAEITYKNEKGDTGIHLGVRANKEGAGYHFTLFPDDPVLAFRTFSLNQDNYIYYLNQQDIRANVRLTGEDNASIWIHSLPENATMQELQAELNHFNLETITEGFPQLPKMEGMLNAEVTYTPMDSTFQLAANIFIDTLVYQGGRVGEIQTNIVYLPVGNGEQQVDVHLFRDGHEAVTATASYRSGTPDKIDGTISINELPMAMISPFIPDNIVSLSGALYGDMTITGSTARPDLNGYLRMDTAAVFVTPANSTFRIDDQQIEVNQSLISFNEYKLYSESNDPFIIDGTVDIGTISNMVADLTMKATNMELLDADRTPESIVYGKLVMDFNSTIKGPVNSLAIRGDIHLLGNTNATYVLTDSPLTVQDRMDGLVTFVNFADTFDINRDRRREVTPLGGMDILFVVRIDQSVRLAVDLTADQSNRVEVIGGGDLTFQSNSEGIIVLNGTYTLSGGTVSYTLPVVPLKDFSIHDGSYITWNGDPVDPTVNLTATERVRASVASEGSGSRLVNFDVGIVVTGTLEDLSLKFTLDAPDDATVQSELVAMGDEEEQRQAVGMLITGRYLAGGGDGNMNFDMGSALNSFLQNEIGNIAGDALKSVDISFDMDTYNDDGQSRTDYSFKFAKRFYNDRIQVVIGGRVSTDSDFGGNSQTFIDDVSVEYRLDNSGTRYVKVFHDTNYESLLEGEITETGVGLVLRKKMRYLKELFIFRKKKAQPVTEEEGI